MVLYDDGTSLTTVSEPIARSLAEAERQRGHRVTIRRLDDDPDSAPEPAPEPAPAPEPTRAPEPTQTVEPVVPAQTVEPVMPQQTVEPAQTVESAPVPRAAREPEPARPARPARGRRLLLYALAASSIVVAAALADHWDALPRVGATTSSSPAHVSGPSHRPQLLPPLDQPPVMHFSNAVRARSRGG
jgi:hypothetical protein